MLRGWVPPQVFNHRRALLSLGPVLAECTFRRALLSPCTPLAVHFPYRALLSRGICSATLSGVVSRFIPRSINKNGQTFCMDACAGVLD